MKVHLQVIEGPEVGRKFSFETRDRFLIGRAPTANFQILNDPFFSRHHLMLEVNPPNVLLQDLKSRNGTYVNNDRVDKSRTLVHGDTIWGGKTRIELTIEDDAANAVTQQTISPPTPMGGTPRPKVGMQSTHASQPPSGDKIAVKCLRCNAMAANELPRSRAENMTYICDRCQNDLVNEPQLLPSYKVVKLLGRGGMGAVYLAVHPQDGRRAIKMILPRAALSERIRDMFLREVGIQSKLDHPNIVRVFSVEQGATGTFLMIMEYVEGESAEDLLKSAPRGLSPQYATNIVAQALAGLGHAHQSGIVHRDIKDANLLVSRDPRGQLVVKLTDFGLAKSYEQTGASGFTKTGDISGTIPYMAPEQILDFKNVKPPADLYSMGATLYHLLTNQLAYNFRREADPLVTILEEAIVPLQTRNPSLPAPLCAVVEKALQKNPKARYATAAEMHAALLAAIP